MLITSVIDCLHLQTFSLAGVTRPTRRGPYFHRTRPRKAALSRHYHKVRFSLSLHQFHVCYWMSFAHQKGFEVKGGRLSLSSEHILGLTPVQDGLIHRPRADWSIAYMNCELSDSEVWLLSSLKDNLPNADEDSQQHVRPPYFHAITWYW